MKITTESGSVYEIDDGFCVKRDSDGNRVDSFKVWTMKSIPNPPISWKEFHELPNSFPVIGEHLFVSGRDVWWLSTKVVKIEE